MTRVWFSTREYLPPKAKKSHRRFEQERQDLIRSLALERSLVHGERTEGAETKGSTIPTQIGKKRTELGQKVWRAGGRGVRVLQKELNMKADASR